jgi:hypothetical protein
VKKPNGEGRLSIIVDGLRDLAAEPSRELAGVVRE